MSNDANSENRTAGRVEADWKWPTVQEFVDRIVDDSAKRDAKYIRLLGPGRDSGWLLVGDNPHDSAKYQARRNHQGGEGFYFISKSDRFDPNLRTPDTARPIYGHPHPIPVWTRQKPWKDNFPLPADLWSGPEASEERLHQHSPEAIRKGLAEQVIKQLAKGPGRTLAELAVLEALKSPDTREK